jgi:hypothetical protein
LFSLSVLSVAAQKIPPAMGGIIIFFREVLQIETTFLFVMFYSLAIAFGCRARRQGKDHYHNSHKEQPRSFHENDLNF